MGKPMGNGHPLAEPAQVVLHHRHQQRVEHGRRGALELTQLRAHAVGQGDEIVPEHLAQDLADALLMVRIRIGVQ